MVQDWNAAINILHRGIAAAGWEIEPSTLPGVTKNVGITANTKGRSQKNPLNYLLASQAYKSLNFGRMAAVSLCVVLGTAALPFSAVSQGSQTSPSEAQQQESSLALDGDARSLVQSCLRLLGYNPGSSDGVFGSKTRAAIRAWQSEHGLAGIAAEGFLSAQERDNLLASCRDMARDVGQRFRDCEVCPEMVVIPSGSFNMGEVVKDQRFYLWKQVPVHRVIISQPLAVGVYEVMFSEWDACYQNGGCSHNPEGFRRNRRPVINISWNDAQEYVAWLSRRTGENYRLPSEAEWEYFARAGTTTRYHFGNTISTRQANFGYAEQSAVSVGSYPANAFGLHDVHGNVAEFTEDCAHDDYTGAPSDGSAWFEDQLGICRNRMVRGGSWGEFEWNIKSSDRYAMFFNDRYSEVGFRVVRTIKP